MTVIVFAPDLENIRASFEVPKRYYQRNKEMVEACELLHAFISAETGLTGGTKFEVEYALNLGIGVHIHWENGLSQYVYRYPSRPHRQNRLFLLSWEKFFRNTDLGPSRAKCKIDGLMKQEGFWYD